VKIGHDFNAEPGVSRHVIDVTELPVHPKQEPARGEPFDWAAFMERTRRYFRLTHQPQSDAQYARGLDSKREDFA
jgi:hypothetical protein